ncbi:HD domain-containing protein [Abyssalbus ytuae]|uniref:HD domain-containing protein n=1 Tax=Abyssalbus ytuae TaxID=2926907 RepID=A0A9E6ZRX4_9FLAO|nr:HD domain-containing protein [Abyssalbus ytuae]UOB19440.1 HD domain-containing protein [Abyssalbus ytuae]
MTTSEIIDHTITFVKQTLENAEGGHDWFHIQRVFNNAILIAKDEKNIDPLVIGLGALLHDIADSKFYEGDETIGPKKARKFLEGLNIKEEVITHVENIIKNISFKGGNFEQKFTSAELDIIQDADRLDAMGAIGIARCFNYGGYKNRAIYNPDIAPNPNMSKEEYKTSAAPSINHFYEKLLLLQDRMNTRTGKKIARARHEFMEKYLEQFYAEWNGER